MERPKPFALLPHSAPRRITDPLVGVIARTGVTPNQLSVAGFTGNVGAAALAARGQFLPAGLLMLGASALDLLDGALARATGRESPFGAVLDSVLDRLSEAAVLSGLAFYFAGKGRREEVALCAAALAGSLLVSYVRARALEYGFDLREGFFTRVERVLLLSGGLIIGQVRIALWVLAVMANVTAAQRVYAVRRRFGNEDVAAPESKEDEEGQ
ncbi:MAG: CDP-alcohol phosphatidyltransferase family protein [Dehalococcoidia bacterium]|nr:CDP-alcohol phosphatidyltransferase family protein [Dehalococcoidia bacterium]MDZ4278671.1 CDP-alcohol phosphatidyltransferase family protein [Dehalococcoidia bacterium]